jgi:transcription-repair coupling factor (superfamily II helicase)
MRDLEIRGAGDLLGTRQHGYIAAVGFHLYTRLLADSVRRLRTATGDQSPESTSPLDAINLPLAMPVNVDLPLAVGIPSDYIPDQELRLRLYRRIADLRDESEIDAIALEFNDRFGLLPETVQNLLYQMRIKLRAEEIGLASISMENGHILLRYPPPEEGVSAPRLPDLGPAVRGGRNVYRLMFGHEPDWPARLLDMLEQIRTLRPSILQT